MPKGLKPLTFETSIYFAARPIDITNTFILTDNSCENSTRFSAGTAV